MKKEKKFKADPISEANSFEEYSPRNPGKMMNEINDKENINFDKKIENTLQNVTGVK